MSGPRFGEWQAHIQEPFGFSNNGLDYCLFLTRRIHGGKREALCADGTVVTLSGEADAVADLQPFARFDTDMLQAVMDVLWARGIRPQERRFEEEAKLLREIITLQQDEIAYLRKEGATDE